MVQLKEYRGAIYWQLNDEFQFQMVQLKAQQREFDQQEYLSFNSKWFN